MNAEKVYIEECTRCCGTGDYSFNFVDGTMCYGCRGTGTRTFKTSPKVRAAARAKREAKADAVEAQNALIEAEKIRTANDAQDAAARILLNDSRLTTRERDQIAQALDCSTQNVLGFQTASQIQSGTYGPWIVRGLLSRPSNWGAAQAWEPSASELNEQAEMIDAVMAIGSNLSNPFLNSLLDRVEGGRLLTANQTRALKRLA